MIWFYRILIFIIGVPVGLYMVRYKDRIVANFGKMAWAEKSLGAGGTYNAWVIFGMIIMIISALIITGSLPGQAALGL